MSMQVVRPYHIGHLLITTFKYILYNILAVTITDCKTGVFFS